MSIDLPTPLLAITIHPWWAFAIAHGDKRIEYRTRLLPASLIGVPVALHAGASSPGERRGVRSLDPPRVYNARELGAPIDDWRAHGCVSSAVVAVVVFYGNARGDDLPLPWRAHEFIGWRIGEVHRLSLPVPAAGKQGWWKCTEQQREAISRGMDLTSTDEFVASYGRCPHDPPHVPGFEDCQIGEVDDG